MAQINFRNIHTSGFDEDALTTNVPGDLIVNFGRLTTTGDLADGIFAGADKVSIRNLGHIETFGLGAAGIFADGNNARIDNYGVIVTHGGFFSDQNGNDFFSEGIFANGDDFSIRNFGSIHVEGKFSSGLVGVGADGVAINYGIVDSTSDGNLLEVDGDRSEAINVGVLTSRGHDTDTMHIDGEDAVGLNLGQIVVTGPGISGMAGVMKDTQVINKGAILVSGTGSFGVGGFGDGHHVTNFGWIETHGTFATGMEAIGDSRFGTTGTGMILNNAGHIITSGDLAIGIALGLDSFGDGFQPAVDDTIANSGEIRTAGAGAAGVVIAGDGHHFVNSGHISTNGGAFEDPNVGVPLDAAGVIVTGKDTLVENTRSGLIESGNASSPAIELNTFDRSGVTAADTSSHLDNFGVIKAPSIAIQGGAGQETVVNHGRIFGDVVLGSGNDTFVFGSGGHIAGDVYLGAGDDHVVVENRSGVSKIADLSMGDTVDVSAFFSDYDQLASHAKQHGNDVVITLDGNDTLVLEHVKLANLQLHDQFII